MKLDVELPPAKRKAIAGLGYGTNAKLMVGFDERVWRTTHRTTAASSRPAFQSTWETAAPRPGPRASSPTSPAAPTAWPSDGARREDQADRLCPRPGGGLPRRRRRAGGEKEVRFHWPSHPWTKGSYASYLVGQWTTIAGAEGEAVGPLRFAGEHCSLEAQGFMEGGCETGEAAAQALLEEMGVKKAALRRAG